MFFESEIDAILRQHQIKSNMSQITIPKNTFNICILLPSFFITDRCFIILLMLCKIVNFMNSDVYSFQFCIF